MILTVRDLGQGKKEHDVMKIEDLGGLSWEGSLGI